MKPLMCNSNTTPGTTFRLLSIAAAVCFALSLSVSLSSLQRESLSFEKVQFNITDNSTEQCTCDSAIINSSSIPPLSSPPSSIAATFDLHGDVSDCCCSFATIERANIDKVHPLLQRIVSTPFFAHFKIDLCSDCELWEDEPMCMLRYCGVCECESPPAWADAVDWMPITADNNGVVDDDDDDDCGGQHTMHVDDRVVPMVDSHVSESWTASSVPFFFDESSEQQQPTSIKDDDTAVVVDLRLNPERYTGYAGQSAEKVWTSIHQDNCFQQNEDGDDDDDDEDASDAGYCNLPVEQRLYNRIISGMHSSISLHIAHSYCLEMDPERIAECKTWGHNATLAHDRVLNSKDRLENLYVAFAVMLRAVQKAGPSIAAAVPVGDPFYADSISEWTEHLQPEITKMVESCPPTFDETSLFSEGSSSNTAMGGSDDDDDGVESKRLELNRRFRHLLEIMQCVGCDRCKLWGTLQTLGVGTALRIILDEDEESSQGGINLSRQEAVALVHTLERFSSALVYMRDLQEV